MDCNELFTSLAKGNFITQTDGKSLEKNDSQGYFYDPLRLIPQRAHLKFRENTYFLLLVEKEPIISERLKISRF